jgi:hypothetical protein
MIYRFTVAMRVKKDVGALHEPDREKVSRKDAKE